ncbi:MAG: hypothetical protein K0U74_04675 [Alphaproteobacteria bacterium]|nr:hypothetical protein [Alphaproteobacteria bacterium]
MVQRIQFSANALFYANAKGSDWLAEHGRLGVVCLALFVSACSEGPQSFPLSKSDATAALKIFGNVPDDAKLIIWPQRRRVVEVVAGRSFSRLIEEVVRERSFFRYSYFPKNGRNLFIVDVSRGYQKHQLINKQHSRLMHSKMRRLNGVCSHFGIVSTRLGVYAGVVFFDGKRASAMREVTRDCLRKALWLVNISGLSPSRFSGFTVGSARALVTAIYRCAEEGGEGGRDSHTVSGLVVKPSVKCAKQILMQAANSKGG